MLAVGSALAGRRLRASEEAHRGIALLQSALIDSTLDGICLTDADGNILISNRPLRRLVTELGMPAHGTVPERLLALADSITEPERYRARMLELAHEPGAASTRRVRDRGNRSRLPWVHGARPRGRRRRSRAASGRCAR